MTAREAGDDPARVSDIRYPSILRAVASTVWAITEEKYHAIVDFLSAKAAGQDIEPMAMGIGGGVAVRGLERVGSVGVISVSGTITHRRDAVRESSGLMSAERISQLLALAMGDSSIRSIVLNINSPGGTVPGIPELADEIHEARKTKRIVAVANSMAASAGYWLSAAASEVVVIPSGSVGSIGVFAGHEDLSRALERRGVTVTLISAGKHKVEGNPFEPLTDEARAAIQERVNTIYGTFVEHVARGRGTTVEAVREGFGQGRMVLAAEAVRLGMADRVATLNEVIRDLDESPAKQDRTMRASNETTAEELQALDRLTEQLTDHTTAARIRALAATIHPGDT